MQELTLLHGEGFARPTLLCCSSLVQSDPTISLHHLTTIGSTSRYHLISILGNHLSVPSQYTISPCTVSVPSQQATLSQYHLGSRSPFTTRLCQEKDEVVLATNEEQPNGIALASSIPSEQVHAPYILCMCSTLDP